MATFEDKAKSLVATAAQIARAQNTEPIATVLEESSASFIQSGSDPEGPTIYTLMLEVPIKTYAAIEGNREDLENAIRERLRPIVRPYADNWISEVIISPTLAKEFRPIAPVPAEPQAVKRYAFTLRLRPGASEAYEKAHCAVWPEMLALLKSAGISEYSIYRRDELLILTLRAVDFEATWSQIENHPVNLRWQETMAPLFAPMESLRPGERFPMMEEVFYLP